MEKSKFIKEHSLSVGYNFSNDNFFDTLNKYRDYIHSFFFSLTNDNAGGIYIPKMVLRKLSERDNYGIPANILFNSWLTIHKDDDYYRRSIEAVKGIVNLQAVTVCYLEDARIIKEMYPDLEVHASVRFWDWCIDKEFNISISDMKELFDVINISGAMSYNDHELIKLIHDNGIKTKIITNEGCIVNRSANYKHFPNCGGYCCSQQNNGGCIMYCKKQVFKEYPWLELCTVNYFKESLQFYDFDILKLSTRYANQDKLISELNYWTSNEPSSCLHNGVYNSFPGIHDHYNEFIEYLRMRSKCDCFCFECQKCKDYYEIFGGKETWIKPI